MVDLALAARCDFHPVDEPIEADIVASCVLGADPGRGVVVLSVALSGAAHAHARAHRALGATLSEQ
eukprot:5001286-Alexandrium_andersonii.AAC.1